MEAPKVEKHHKDEDWITAHPVWVIWLAIISVLTFEAAGAYILSFIFHFGLVGLWAIQSVDESTRLTLNYFRFKGKKWKILKIGT